MTLLCALKSPNWSITKDKGLVTHDQAVQDKHTGLINCSGYRSKTHQSTKAIVLGNIHYSNLPIKCRHSFPLLQLNKFTLALRLRWWLRSQWRWLEIKQSSCRSSIVWSNRDEALNDFHLDYCTKSTLPMLQAITNTSSKTMWRRKRHPIAFRNTLQTCRDMRRHFWSCQHHRKPGVPQNSSGSHIEGT